MASIPLFSATPEQLNAWGRSIWEAFESGRMDYCKCDHIRAAHQVVEPEMRGLVHQGCVAAGCPCKRFRHRDKRAKRGSFK